MAGWSAGPRRIPGRGKSFSKDMKVHSDVVADVGRKKVIIKDGKKENRLAAIGAQGFKKGKYAAFTMRGTAMKILRVTEDAHLILEGMSEQASPCKMVSVQVPKIPKK